MSLKEQAVIAMIKECIQPLLELKKGFEKQENRADDITEGLPVEKYPSVNAVINFVKNKITDFSNNLNTVYVKLLDFEVYKEGIKTSFGNFEKGIADTYATKSGIDDFKNSVADTYATKTDIEDFEENVADTYATKTIVEDLKNDTEATRTASGSAITIDSASAPLQNLKLFGKTEQNGTPTPDAPVPLVSVGDSGSFEVALYGNNKCDKPIGATYTIDENGYVIVANNSQADWYHYVLIENPYGEHTVSFEIENANLYVQFNSSDYSRSFNKNGSVTVTPNGWLRIMWSTKVGTTSKVRVMCNAGAIALPYEPCNKQNLEVPYTLRSDKLGIKDEIDFTRGVLIKKCAKLNNLVFKLYNTNTFVADTTFSNSANSVFCNLYSSYDKNVSGMPDKTFRKASTSQIYVRDTSFANVTEINNAYANGELEFIGELQTPIEIPLTETELNAYRQLYTNKGTTTVLSEAEAEVDYYINKPNAQAIGNIHSQVNEDYFKLQQAIISLGGN